MEPASTRINSVCTDGFCTQGTERSALYNEKFRPLVSQARLYAQTPHTLMRWAWQRLERRFGVLSAPVELNRPTRLRSWRRRRPHPRHVPHRSIYDALGRLLRHDRAGGVAGVATSNETDLTLGWLPYLPLSGGRPSAFNTDRRPRRCVRHATSCSPRHCLATSRAPSLLSTPSAG